MSNSRVISTRDKYYGEETALTTMSNSMTAAVEVRKGAAAAVARSSSTRPNAAAAAAAGAIVNAGDAAAGAPDAPRPKHALEQARCRAATALARDCNDKQQLMALPEDVFAVYLPDRDSFTSFVVCITPKESLWKGATFCFRCTLPATPPQDYPCVRACVRVGDWVGGWVGEWMGG